MLMDTCMRFNKFCDSVDLFLLYWKFLVINAKVNIRSNTRLRGKRKEFIILKVLYVDILSMS